MCRLERFVLFVSILHVFVRRRKAEPPQRTINLDPISVCNGEIYTVCDTGMCGHIISTTSMLDICDSRLSSYDIRLNIAAGIYVLAAPLL